MTTLPPPSAPLKIVGIASTAAAPAPRGAVLILS